MFLSTFSRTWTHTKKFILGPFINIKGNNVSTNLFGKRDIFPYAILRMPSLTIDIPPEMFCVGYGPEIPRNITVTSTKTIFINHCSNAISRIINLGKNVYTISKFFLKIFSWQFWTFVESISTWNNCTLLFWLWEVMENPLCFSLFPIGLICELWGGRVLISLKMLMHGPGNKSCPSPWNLKTK